MKLSRIFTVVGVFALLSLASCKKEVCYECTLDTESQTLCEDDYPSVLGIGTFQPAIDVLEGSGFTCTKQ
jgi:hypothetical protein